MSESIIPIRISDSLLRDASLQASRKGVSLEDWLLAIAAERILEERTFERFFRRMPEASDGRVMMEIPDSAKDNPPDPGDELPEGYLSSRAK